VVFGVVTLCNDVAGYHWLGGPWDVVGKDGGSMVLQNVGVLTHYFVVSQPRRPQHES